MATQTVVGNGGIANVVGGSLQIRDALTNALVQTQIATETSSGSTVYSANFTDVPAGDYRLVFVNPGGSVQYTQWVTLKLATGSYAGLEVPVGDLKQTKSMVGFVLAREAGACANPQTAVPQYVITAFGATYTVTMSGVTSTGVRGAPTLTET